MFASELSVEARATAMSLHSFFFFMGQTVGPIAYGFGIQHVGKVPTLLTSAAVMIALGFACARLLRQTRPADAGAAQTANHADRLAGRSLISRGALAPKRQASCASATGVVCVGDAAASSAVQPALVAILAGARRTVSGSGARSGSPQGRHLRWRRPLRAIAA